MKNIYGQQPIFFRSTRNEEFNRLNEFALEKEKEKRPECYCGNKLLYSN